MGKLLSLLSRDDSNCCSSPRYDIFLDFENAAPTDTERDVYEDVQRVLLDSERILEEIQCYKGAGREIREAIADPSRISQERAWRAVKPLVDKLLRCYNHSLELQRVSYLFFIFSIKYNKIRQNTSLIIPIVLKIMYKKMKIKSQN